MNADTAAAHAASRARARRAAGRAFATGRRRRLQLSLAAIWLIDGLLQLQAFMFTESFAAQILAPAAHGNPSWIADPILWSARFVAANPVWTNALFAALQLGIGLGIACRRTVKPALAVSILWSLLVWWFGEGLGGLLVPGSSALAGAPGAVLLYAVLAVLLWPAGDAGAAESVAETAVGPSAAKAVWVVLWGGLAALNLEPANLAPQGLRTMVEGMAAGQPGWLHAAMTAFGSLSDGAGVPFTVIGTAVLALIAVGVLFPPRLRRIAVVAAVVVAAFVWVVGEALGGVFGGRATDLNSGPLLGLLALAYWPRAAWHDEQGSPGAAERARS